MRRPVFLLNFSTHKADMVLFHGKWEKLYEFCKAHHMDGIELYPVGELDPGSIPNGLVKGVHLTCTLSQGYIETTKKRAKSLMISAPDGFWERLSTARKHVMALDRHDPFTLPWASEVIDITKPKYVVFEFRYLDKKSWTEKIETPKKALSIFWP